MKTIHDPSLDRPVPQVGDLQCRPDHVAGLKIRIDLGRKRVPVEEIQQIEPGSVIELDSRVSDRVDVYVDGCLYARGEAVVVDMASKEAQPTARVGVVVREIIAGLNRQTLGHYKVDSPDAPAIQPAVAAPEQSIKSGLKRVIAMVLLTMALAIPTLCASADPASQSGTVESQVIRNSSSEKNRSGQGANNANIDWGQLGQTAGALAVVVTLIFLTRWLLKRLGRRSGFAAQTDLIGVLARAPLGPKYQLALVRLGQRLVLVGCSPQGLTRLSEITDPAEVAALTAAAERSNTNLLKNLFKPREGQDQSDRTSAGDMADKIRQRLSGKDSA